MKHLLACAFAVLATHAALAQEPDAAAERKRIDAERAAVEARFATAQRVCRGKFAVNDCMLGIKRERNAALGDLRRQELLLNQEDRRRRAVLRQQALDDRNSPEQQQQAEERRLKAMQDQQDREQRAGEKAGQRAATEAERAQRGPRVKTPKAGSGPQGDPHAPHGAPHSGPTPEQAARNRAAYEAHVKDAEEHKAQVRDRNAKRAKPASSGLPPPR